MTKEYGEWIHDHLEQKSNTIVKIKTFEIEGMIKYYKAKGKAINED
jgi:hypothetical protein